MSSSASLLPASNTMLYPSPPPETPPNLRSDPSQPVFWYADWKGKLLIGGLVSSISLMAIALFKGLFFLSFLALVTTVASLFALYFAKSYHILDYKNQKLSNAHTILSDAHEKVSASYEKAKINLAEQAEQLQRFGTSNQTYQALNKKHLNEIDRQKGENDRLSHHVTRLEEIIEANRYLPKRIEELRTVKGEFEEVKASLGEKTNALAKTERKLAKTKDRIKSEVDRLTVVRGQLETAANRVSNSPDALPDDK